MKADPAVKATDVHDADQLAPILLHEVDVAGPIADIVLTPAQAGRRYGSIRCLARLHTRPLGIVDLAPHDGGVSGQELAQAIWGALGAQILEHLQADGLAAIDGLTASGLPPAGRPRCLHARQRMLDQAPTVSIIVCTRNRPASIAACLDGMAGLAYPRYEIIVVDNAPANGETREIVRQRCARMPHLRYVREDCPGLSRARNRGLATAQGEIIAITDDDIVPDPHWLSELVHGFSLGDRVACVTGPILPQQLETPAQLLIEQYGGFSKGFRRRLFDLGENRPPDRLYPFAAGIFGSGANAAFKTSVLKALGGYDPALGAGSPACSGEDFALFVQLITSEYQIAYEPGAIIYHAHHRDYAMLRKQIYGYGVGMTAYLLKCLLENPRLLPSLIGSVPPGLLYTLSPRSPKNHKRKAGYPGELVALELRGYLAGPVAYARSRRWVRQTQAQPIPAPHRELPMMAGAEESERQG